MQTSELSIKLSIGFGLVFKVWVVRKSIENFEKENFFSYWVWTKVFIFIISKFLK